MKFKIGDAVRIVKLTQYCYCAKIGNIGIVSDIDKDDLDLPIGLNINGISNYYFKEEELELVQKETTKSINNKIAYIPHYPEDFYDFSNGVDISDEEINQWIKECIDGISKTESDSYYISSGNTKVIVFKSDEGYEVNVIKDYKECTKYFDNNINKE